jgi:hypothetical protein
MTNWVMVPNLDEGRNQLNDRFPKRAKLAEGGIGDTAHQKSTSSHNPDDTSGASAEFNDKDGKREIRARDYDKNLNDDKGVVMEDVVQLWVKLARQGVLWWVRYIIYNGRIWHKKDGFVSRKYTGSNRHTDHAHVNSDFTAKADEITGTNWHLADLDKTKPAATPSKPKALDVDGQWGDTTTKALQRVLKVNVDGDLGPKTIKALQSKLKGTVNSRLDVDGDLGPHTIAALQKYLRSPVDGRISKPKSQMVMQLQRRLNAGSF